MTEAGLQSLVTYLRGIYLRLRINPSVVTVWREQFRPYSDAAVMGAARAWVADGRERPPNAAVLTAGARGQARPSPDPGVAAMGELVREFPDGPTLHLGHSRCPRGDNEPLYAYMIRLREWLIDQGEIDREYQRDG